LRIVRASDGAGCGARWAFRTPDGEVSWGDRSVAPVHTADVEDTIVVINRDAQHIFILHAHVCTILRKTQVLRRDRA
jgi:hypothetical protein